MSKTTLLGEQVAIEAINLYKQNCAEKGTNVVYCGNQKLTMPYVSDGDAWCVGFVQLCYKRALDKYFIADGLPKTAAVLYLYETLKKMGYVVDNVPAVGSIGFRRTGITTSKKLKDGSGVSHAFIVVEVGSKEIITVEGNTSDKIDFRYYPNSSYALSDHLFIHAEVMGNTKVIQSGINFQLVQTNSSQSSSQSSNQSSSQNQASNNISTMRKFRKRHFG